MNKNLFEKLSGMSKIGIFSALRCFWCGCSDNIKSKDPLIAKVKATSRGKRLGGDGHVVYDGSKNLANDSIVNSCCAIMDKNKSRSRRLSFPHAVVPGYRRLKQMLFELVM